MSIFNSVADLRLSTLKAGDHVETRSYYADTPIDTVGAASYLVVKQADFGGAPDDVGNILLFNGNVAQLIVDSDLKAAQWGLKKSAIGAVGFDNSANLQALVDYASLTGSVISFEAGRYYLNTGVTIPTNNDGTGINSVIFQGAGRTRTEIFTDQTINMITHNDYFVMRDLFLAQRGEDGGTKYTGSALYSTGQVRFCDFDNVNIWWFKFGTIWRFSLWNNFSNMSYNGNLCGIKLARNDDMEDQDNPSPPGTWNAGDGWFHNQNTFNTILFNGDKESNGGRGEIGFWGAVQGTDFSNITCQNYERSGAIPNETIPLGQVSTCMEIQGGGPTSAQTFNNKLDDYYIERSFKGLKVVNNRRLTINSWFSQGQAGGENLLEVDTSDVTIRGQTGQTPGFTNGVYATDSNITLDKPLAASGTTRVLNNSYLSENGIPIPDTVKNVTVTASAGTGGGSLTLLPDADVLAYTRQGSSVVVTGRVAVDTVASLTGDFFNIDGLPFAPSNEPDNSGNAAVSITYFPAGGGTLTVPGLIVENSTSIRVYYDGATVAAGDEIHVSATYLSSKTS